MCDYHSYPSPSGQKVIKGFLLLDFVFNDSNNNCINDLSDLAYSSRAHSMKITWHIQMNHQNGQSIKLVAESANPLFCLVCNLMLPAEIACHLGQPSNLPVCIYPNQKGELLYLSGSNVASLLYGAILFVHLTSSKSELNKYLNHSLHIWACVLLDKAVKSLNLIRNCFDRWAIHFT